MAQIRINTRNHTNDRLEQYSRRETIRFSGISSDVGDSEDNLIEEVKKIAGALEVPIKSEDISVIHRAGKPGPGKSRPVLCKFVSRRTRDNLMKKRKMLKDKPEFKDKVYMNEDLTPLRAKLLAYAKGLPDVNRVNSHNGRIHCNTSDNKHFILDSPDDLHDLGVTTINLDKLGLNHYNI